MNKFFVFLALVFGALSVLVRLLAWPVAFAFAVWLLIGYARGHSWYDPECCSDQDCYAVPAEDVIETDTGWKHLPTGVEFSRQQVKPSKDNRFHVCIGNKAWDRGKPYCIYILQGV